MQARNWEDQNWRKSTIPAWQLGFKVDETQNKWALIHIPASALQCACREGVCLPAVKGFKWKYQDWCFSWTFKSKICVWLVFNRFYFVLCLQIMANVFLILPSLTCPFPQVQLLKLFHNISVHSRSCSCGSCKQFGNLVSTLLCYWETISMVISLPMESCFWSIPEATVFLWGLLYRLQ